MSRPRTKPRTPPGTVMADCAAPVRVEIVYPHQHEKGRTRPDWTVRDPCDAASLKQLLTATLAGVATETTIDLTAWPITTEQWGDQFESDAQVAALVCQFLHLDQVAYIGHVCRAQALVRDAPFRRLMSAIRVGTPSPRTPPPTRDRPDRVEDRLTVRPSTIVMIIIVYIATIVIVDILIANH